MLMLKLMLQMSATHGPPKSDRPRAKWHTSTSQFCIPVRWNLVNGNRTFCDVSKHELSPKTGSYHGWKNLTNV